MAGNLKQTAKEKFKEILKNKLTKPNGKKRNIYLNTADEHFDSNGRLLAYIAPHYKKKELANMTLYDRATFNLLMVESGWAASFPIFPSLPN